MYTILIVGAGQLGSRHLQGAKTSHNELDIWVYDLSEESLTIAKERYNQVISQTAKLVHYVQSLDFVPKEIDVTIVATSSKPRYDIVKQILTHHEVKYLVLEKFLFPRLSDYDEIQKLIEEKNVKTYVNCPRRMYESYHIAKDYIDSSQPIRMFFKGKDWGLCCNSIHFIDIFMYLSKSLDYDLNTDNIIPEVVDSKRNGYVELRGTEIITSENGSTLELLSTTDYEGDGSVVILSGSNKISIQESKGIIFVNDKSMRFNVLFQSSLSGVFVDNLLDNDICSLTPYYESAKYHKKYLEKILPLINKLRGWTSDSCPIT